MFNIVGVSIGSPIGGFIALVGTKLVLLSAGFAVFIGGVGVFLMDKLLRRFGDENTT
ncbi:hypothetical protein [Pyrococcus furiosus]|uniref:hypothetical protein n=1 Tax=Pyrococcus furiosus TaxID=2261 RepID=UPI000ADCD6D6|nr:hypothetical protein [Pyrococcus furiosus]